MATGDQQGRARWALGGQNVEVDGKVQGRPSLRAGALNGLPASVNACRAGLAFPANCTYSTDSSCFNSKRPKINAVTALVGRTMSEFRKTSHLSLFGEDSQVPRESRRCTQEPAS